MEANWIRKWQLLPIVCVFQWQNLSASGGLTPDPAPGRWTPRWALPPHSRYRLTFRDRHSCPPHIFTPGIEVHHIVRTCMWRRHCCLTSFSDCRYMPSLRRYSPTKLCDGAQMANFLRRVFSISASRVQHISDLPSKFAPRPHHVWKYGRHPMCDGWE